MDVSLPLRTHHPRGTSRFFATIMGYKKTLAGLHTLPGLITQDNNVQYVNRQAGLNIYK